MAKQLLRTIRLGLAVVVLVICMRTIILLLSFTDDVYKVVNGNSQNRLGRGILEKSLEDQPQCSNDVSRPRKDQIHIRNQMWQVHDIDSPRNELFIYSAFYDNRRNVGPWPVIRILGIAIRDHIPYYCQIWYSGIQKPYIVQAEEVKNGRGDSFRGNFYGQYMYTCKLDTFSVIPTHVSMTTHMCNSSTTYLPVVRPNRTLHDDNFAICVPISFGDINQLELIEWFELVKMLGVSHVYVYNATLSPELAKLFNYYSSTGLLHVHQMPPAIDLFNKKGAKLSSPASLNDCMLRNMFAYRYIIMIDFDEVIVPRNYDNYTQMIKTIKKNHKLKDDSISYTFRNTYFFIDIPPDPKENIRHRMLRYRSRMAPSRYLYAAKSFIDPRHCLSAFNHYCYIRFPSAGPHWTVDVNTNIAMSHHYRNCNLGKVKCNTMRKSKTSDDIMLRYRDKLHNMTKLVINMIQ